MGEVHGRAKGGAAGIRRRKVCLQRLCVHVCIVTWAQPCAKLSAPHHASSASPHTRSHNPSHTHTHMHPTHPHTPTCMHAQPLPTSLHPHPHSPSSSPAPPPQVDYEFPPNATISESCRDLIRRILVANPLQRLTIRQIQASQLAWGLSGRRGGCGDHTWAGVGAASGRGVGGRGGEKHGSTLRLRARAPGFSCIGMPCAESCNPSARAASH